MNIKQLVNGSSRKREHGKWEEEIIKEIIQEYIPEVKDTDF